MEFLGYVLARKELVFNSLGKNNTWLNFWHVHAKLCSFAGCPTYAELNIILDGIIPLLKYLDVSDACALVSRSIWILNERDRLAP